MLTRRQVLAGIATGVVGSTGVGAASHPESQPEHVTITYDQELLHRYRPQLAIAPEDRRRLLGIHGWITTSTEYDYDWYVYWAEYSHQEGVTSFDSHYGDREPIQVGVAPETGEVRRLIYSGYHWLAARAAGDTIPLADETHPTLQVVTPWHHYTLSSPDRGALYEVTDLDAVLDAWLANGLEEDLSPGAVHNPATMRTRGYWWRDDLGVTSSAALRANVRLLTGFGVDEEQVDSARIETTI